MGVGRTGAQELRLDGKCTLVDDGDGDGLRGRRCEEECEEGEHDAASREGRRTLEAGAGLYTDMDTARRQLIMQNVEGISCPCSRLFIL